MKRVHIALVGDFNEKKHTHVALNDCLAHCRRHLPFTLDATWTPTDKIGNLKSIPSTFQALWITPGSPYKDDEAVYQTIRWARENNFPVLGTCGGFQYMVVEFARNVIGLKDADHEESTPGASDLVVTKMSCSLKGQKEEVFITDWSSWLYTILQREVFTGYFNCSYGVNPAYQEQVEQEPMEFTAFSRNGEVRALEIKQHRFFKGTLFQPPLDSSAEHPNLLIMDFLRTVSK
jgi:CTP synthase (UTP-ammonia lyase)